MKNFTLITVFIFSLFMLFSCNSESGEDSNGVKTYDNGNDLGKAIGDDFIQSTKDLEAILKKDLPLEDLKKEIVDLKEKYVKIFVAYGKQKAKLDASEKAKCDQVLWDVFMQGDQKRLDFINSKASPIGEEDWELYEIIASMNIITQYSDFELLKRQSPEEAKRLGIE